MQCYTVDYSQYLYVDEISLFMSSQQCNKTRTLELFNTDISLTDVPTNQSLVAVIGAGCSPATEVLASNMDVPTVS